jgi:ABC-type antimicrobial peptide transport system permease subunit
MLPFRYALRNLFRDTPRMLQAVGGSALVTLLVMGAAALNQGMTRVLSASGNPRNVILLGAGSEDSLQRSEIPDRAAGIAEAAIPGIVSIGSRRAVSPELHFMGYLSAAGREPVQTLLRGVTPGALLVHTDVTLIEGGFPGPGELLAGRLAWKSLGGPAEQLQVGSELEFEEQRFRVSGLFAAPGTVMESEIWADLNDLRTLTQRDNLSGIVLRMEEADPADARVFTTRRLDLELAAMQESEYYAGLSAFYRPIRTMTWITAALIGVGAVVGGFNTLYAAFAARIAELATLQTLGFSRPAILMSLIQEALLASLLGALAACVLAISVFDGQVISFSMGTFALRMTPEVILAGLGTGMALGLLGAIPPALRCLLPPLPAALRSAA